MTMLLGNVQNFIHTLADTETQQTSSGGQVITSGKIKTAFPFSSLFLSVNCVLPPKSFVLVEAQVCTQKEESPFYKIALLSNDLKTSFPPQEDNWVRVATDEILLKKPASFYRYRLRISGGAEITLLTTTIVKDPFVYNEKKASKMPAGTYQIKINPISQMEQSPRLRRRICSPVSLCMALRSLGENTPLPDVINNVFDPTADIYGNWLFNVVYAATQNTSAYVRRFETLTELPDFLTTNSRILASIAFGKNELAEAPLSHTIGHLVLICGWEKGKILVADPAAPSAQTVCRAYNAHEFAHAWLCNKKGIAYIVRKK